MGRDELKALADKFSRDKWEMYCTFHLKKKTRGDGYVIGERVYATYDRPDWNYYDSLSATEAQWMNEHSDVKFWS